MTLRRLWLLFSAYALFLLARKKDIFFTVTHTFQIEVKSYHLDRSRLHWTWQVNWNHGSPSAACYPPGSCVTPQP